MTYEAYENYGSMPLADQIMKLCPWVGGDDAHRIADECMALPDVVSGGRKSEKAYRFARHVFAEARKLKT